MEEKWDAILESYTEILKRKGFYLNLQCSIMFL